MPTVQLVVIVMDGNEDHAEEFINVFFTKELTIF